jgi:hypothetical protein
MRESMAPFPSSAKPITYETLPRGQGLFIVEEMSRVHPVG